VESSSSESKAYTRSETGAWEPVRAGHAQQENLSVIVRDQGHWVERSLPVTIRPGFESGMICDGCQRLSCGAYYMRFWKTVAEHVDQLILGQELGLVLRFPLHRLILVYFPSSDTVVVEPLPRLRQEPDGRRLHTLASRGTWFFQRPRRYFPNEAVYLNFLLLVCTQTSVDILDETVCLRGLSMRDLANDEDSFADVVAFSKHAGALQLALEGMIDPEDMHDATTQTISGFVTMRVHQQGFPITREGRDSYMKRCTQTLKKLWRGPARQLNLAHLPVQDTVLP